MNMCEDGHQEIVFEGRSCPACEILKEKEELQDEVARLKDEISTMES